MKRSVELLSVMSVCPSRHDLHRTRSQTSMTKRASMSTRLCLCACFSRKQASKCATLPVRCCSELGPSRSRRTRARATRTRACPRKTRFMKAGHRLDAALLRRLYASSRRRPAFWRLGAASSCARRLAPHTVSNARRTSIFECARTLALCMSGARGVRLTSRPSAPSCFRSRPRPRHLDRRRLACCCDYSQHDLKQQQSNRSVAARVLRAPSG